MLLDFDDCSCIILGDPYIASSGKRKWRFNSNEQSCTWLGEEFVDSNGEKKVRVNKGGCFEIANPLVDKNGKKRYGLIDLGIDINVAQLSWGSIHGTFSSVDGRSFTPVYYPSLCGIPTLIPCESPDTCLIRVTGFPYFVNFLDPESSLSVTSSSINATYSVWSAYWAYAPAEEAAIFIRWLAKDIITYNGPVTWDLVRTVSCPESESTSESSSDDALVWCVSSSNHNVHRESHKWYTTCEKDSSADCDYTFECADDNSVVDTATLHVLLGITTSPTAISPGCAYGSYPEASEPSPACCADAQIWAGFFDYGGDQSLCEERAAADCSFLGEQSDCPGIPIELGCASIDCAGNDCAGVCIYQATDCIECRAVPQNSPESESSTTYAYETGCYVELINDLQCFIHPNECSIP